MGAAMKSLPATLNLDQVSPVTRLLAKRKEMLNVQAALDAQKSEYIRKEDVFKRREESLRKKDLELQEALVLFNKFLKENEHKRQRAEQKAAEEIRGRQHHENELKVRTTQLAELQQKLEEKRELYAKCTPTTLILRCLS
jgi:Asp-tRNA(Asn)/Glu-tRNA(Gln) amidotransferase A subunit family amidase